MLADYAEKIDLKFNQPSNKVSNVLEKLLPLTATVSNPLDYTTPFGVSLKKLVLFLILFS